MKTSKIIVLFALVLFASCSLDQKYYGGTLTQSQYEQLSNTLEGSMRGIYSQMYAVSDHDQFGQRSIDMYTDLMSADMALTNYNYGWFYTDEKGLSNTARTGYLWHFYYKIVHNANIVINLVNAQSDLTTRVAAKGLPNTYNSSKKELYLIENNDTLATYSEADALIAGYYAQALTMRGFAYSKLLQQYTPTTRDIYTDGSSFEKEAAFPLYNELNMAKAQPLSSIADVYLQVESDLGGAMEYFMAFDAALVRGSKLEVNRDVARGLLAYNYLQKANLTASSQSDSYRRPFENALKYAKAIIDEKQYEVIPNTQVWGDKATGFNDVNSTSWIWGQHVTTETAGGLASFFGQVDIHSYSYAWAGDTKAIDANLFDEIYDFDARAKWFNDGSGNVTFKLCPDGKFFSAKCPKSTKAEDIDREWLSDNVFMRIEGIYLIAAEASYRLGDYQAAKDYLAAITDERVLDGKESEYNTFKGGLNASNLLAYIEYNWRVEMWGEGYGLQTFRRLTPETCSAEKRRRGGNHAANPGTEYTYSSDVASSYKFQIPSSETSYNPEIKGKTLEE